MAKLTAVGEGIAQLNEHLGKHAYVSGTALPSEEDARVLEEIKDVPCRKTYPNVYHWYLFLRMFTPDARKNWGCCKGDQKQDKKEKKDEGKKDEKKQDKKAGKKEDKKEEKEEEFDPFADDGAAPAKKEEAKPAPVAAKPKKAVIAKSILVFDVKIYEAETDLNKLAEKIYEIKMDGLVWNREHKILDVAFGIKKLQVGCVIEDDKVSTDDLFEIIEGWEDVQSTDVVTMQKV